MLLDVSGKVFAVELVTDPALWGKDDDAMVVLGNPEEYVRVGELRGILVDSLKVAMELDVRVIVVSTEVVERVE